MYHPNVFVTHQVSTATELFHRNESVGFWDYLYVIFYYNFLFHNKYFFDSTNFIYI